MIMSDTRRIYNDPKVLRITRHVCGIYHHPYKQINHPGRDCPWCCDPKNEPKIVRKRRYQELIRYILPGELDPASIPLTAFSTFSKELSALGLSHLQPQIPQGAL